MTPQTTAPAPVPPPGPMSRRTLAKGAAWSLPVVAVAVTAPQAAASSVYAWEIDYEPLDQDCAPGSNGGATTLTGWSATNLASPATGTGTGRVVANVTVLIYSNTLYDSAAAAQTDLNTANASFVAHPPAATSTPAGAITNGTWSQVSSAVVDQGDGTYLPASVYQSQVTVLAGIAPGVTVKDALTVNDLPNGFNTQGTLSPITAVNANGDYGSDVFLWDSQYCGVFPPDLDPAARTTTQSKSTTKGKSTTQGTPGVRRGVGTGRIRVVQHRGPLPTIRAWFKTHRHR